jgi:hypothetical protein
MLNLKAFGFMVVGRAPQAEDALINIIDIYDGKSQKFKDILKANKINYKYMSSGIYLGKVDNVSVDIYFVLFNYALTMRCSEIRAVCDHINKTLKEAKDNEFGKFKVKSLSVTVYAKTDSTLSYICVVRYECSKAKFTVRHDSNDDHGYSFSAFVTSPRLIWLMTVSSYTTLSKAVSSMRRRVVKEAPKYEPVIRTVIEDFK